MSPFRKPVRAPEIDELETLVACATDGSLAAAARRLGISRPAVSKRIDNLEALAQCRLLSRSAAGVALTADGARLLAGARRILEERDVLLGVLTEMRSGEPPALGGLRRLLGERSVSVRAAQLPETRLADAERILGLVLRTTRSAISITSLDTGVVYEANDALCRLLGRTRDELVGQQGTVRTDWYSSVERRELVERIRRDGAAHGFVSRLIRADGSESVTSATGYLVSVAGEAVLLWISEEIDGVAAPADGYAFPAVPVDVDGA